MKSRKLVSVERYLKLRRRLSQVSLYAGLAVSFGVLQVMIWLEVSGTMIGYVLAGAFLTEVILYSKFFEYCFGEQGRVGKLFAPSCDKCGGMMLVDRRDKENEVGTMKYYAELDETDEVFECLDCGNTWRNLQCR